MMQIVRKIFMFLLELWTFICLFKFSESVDQKPCDGCLYNGECISGGEIRKTFFHCMQFRCKVLGPRKYKYSYEHTGCFYNGRCIPIGQSSPTAIPCHVVDCQSVEGRLRPGFRNTGCFHNGECVGANQTRDTFIGCLKFTCELSKSSGIFRPNYKYVGCNHGNRCVAPGKAVKTGIPCQEYRCNKHGPFYKGITVSVGCYHKGECVPPGDQRPTEVPCKVYKCQRVGRSLISSYEYVGCFINGKCLAIGKSTFTSVPCQKFRCKRNYHVCQSQRFYTGCPYKGRCLAPGETTATPQSCVVTKCLYAAQSYKLTSYEDGCLIQNGTCVSNGTELIYKSKRRCSKHICGRPDPVRYSCRTKMGECVEVGNTTWGEFAEDGSCRVYRCYTHWKMKVVAREIGSGCSYEEHGCIAPGQSVYIVDWFGCGYRGCYWSSDLIAQKTKNITECSDEYGNCYPVGHYPFVKRGGGELYNNTRCSWDNKTVIYQVVDFDCCPVV